MNGAQTLRSLLQKPGIVRAPGAYDALSARLVAQAGFPAVYMTGYGVSASVLGRPDIGLITQTEMATAAANMVNVLGDTPLIADGDNGYGGVLNVCRTVELYEKAGVAAIQLEDQVFPKRCGHMEGKECIPREEMAAKIRAAVASRRTPDMCIIARTDARAVVSFDDALERARAYAAAGADIIFFEAPQSVEEIRTVAAALDKPLLSNMVEKGKTPMIPGKELEELGYKIVIYPATTLFAAVQGVKDTLASLAEHDTSVFERSVSFPEFNDFIGVKTFRDLEKRFVCSKDSA